MFYFSVFSFRSNLNIKMSRLVLSRSSVLRFCINTTEHVLDLIATRRWFWKWRRLTVSFVGCRFSLSSDSLFTSCLSPCSTSSSTRSVFCCTMLTEHHMAGRARLRMFWKSVCVCVCASATSSDGSVCECLTLFWHGSFSYFIKELMNSSVLNL